jgi:hypothetical protein
LLTHSLNLPVSPFIFQNDRYRTAMKQAMMGTAEMKVLHDGACAIEGGETTDLPLILWAMSQGLISRTGLLDFDHGTDEWVVKDVELLGQTCGALVLQHRWIKRKMLQSYIAKKAEAKIAMLNAFAVDNSASGRKEKCEIMLHELRSKNIVDEPEMKALLELESPYLVSAVIRGDLYSKALKTRESLCASIMSFVKAPAIRPVHVLIFKVFVHRSVSRRRRRHMVEAKTEVNVYEAQQKELEEARRKEEEEARHHGRQQMGEMRSSNEAVTSPTRGLFGCVPGCTENPRTERQGGQ